MPRLYCFCVLLCRAVPVAGGADWLAAVAARAGGGAAGDGRGAAPAIRKLFHGAQLRPAGTVALLLYLYPVLVMLLSAWLFGEQLTARKWLAAALTFSGLVITLGLELAGQPLALPWAWPRR